MTNTKLFLLLGTSLSLIPCFTSAQCVATQDCATLGYTETSCSGGTGVKCPFGNKWACFKTDAEYEQEFCTKYGFTQICTGSNQTGGAGQSCQGKYNYCACADGYVWQNGACKQSESDYSTCTVGALYYSDGTCSNNYIASKKLLGIVIYEKSGNKNGWVMTHKQVAIHIAWSSEYGDISGLTNYTSESKLTDIQNSCTNTDKITAKGDSSEYPAAWAAKNYKEGGKTWCLPSGGLLKTALNNLANLTIFNAAIYRIQRAAGANAATILGEIKGHRYESVWSSSEVDSEYAWYFYASDDEFQMFTGEYFSSSTKIDSDWYTIRPVMAF